MLFVVFKIRQRNNQYDKMTCFSFNLICDHSLNMWKKGTKQNSFKIILRDFIKLFYIC